MYTDMDMAMDPYTETFILIGPYSDPCRTVWVNGQVCPSFSSLLMPFPAIISCWCKSTFDLAMPEVSKITKEETEQFTELVRQNVALYDLISDDCSNTPYISSVLESICIKENN